jgi:uncharacterized C2H2 Zn-finger protein
MIKAIKAFTSSLNAANRMGKAPIFLKHRAKNVGKVIKQKYNSLHPYKKAAIEGFGKGLKYGTLAVGSIEVGKGAYKLVTGNKKTNNQK